MIRTLITSMYHPAVLAAITWIAAASCRSATHPASAKDSVMVSTDFDEGSIGGLTESSENVLTGTTKHWKHASSSDDQYYWFFFKADHVKNKTVTIQLDDLAGIYRGKPHLIYTSRTKPVFSYDNINWQRIDSVQYDTARHSLTFTRRFTQSPVWVAYAHPYPYTRGRNFLNDLPKRNDLQIDSIGASRESRPIRLVTITDPSVKDTQKKVVLLTALQHSGETIGGFFMEGMIDYLLSDAPDAQQAKRQIIFKLIPMMNPDGIFHGTTRFNNNREDLNQEWDDDFSDSAHFPVEPEVNSVKMWIRKWLKEGKTIDMGLDVHSQGQEGEMNLLHAPTDSLRGLVQHLNAYWPVDLVPMEFSGSANDCLTHEFHILSGTFEIPQSNINGGSYLTIEDYQAYGRGTARGIADYFRRHGSN